MKKTFVNYLIKNNITISSYESFTGGYFSHLITNVSGASKVFLGGIIVYSKIAKIEVGDVNKDVIHKYGVISSQTAEEMVTACEKKFNTNIVVSFTGNAGPTNLEEKKVGTIFIGLKVFTKYEIISLNLNSHFSRFKIKKIAVFIAMKRILSILEAKGNLKK